jgi:hypothetical protein
MVNLKFKNGEENYVIRRPTGNAARIAIKPASLSFGSTFFVVIFFGNMLSYFQTTRIVPIAGLTKHFCILLMPQKFDALRHRSKKEFNFYFYSIAFLLKLLVLLPFSKY